MSTARRDFLGLVGTAALAGLATPHLAHATTAPTLPEPMAGPWDMSWTKRVRGKHRAVFDAPEVSDGLPTIRAVVWGRQMSDVYGTKPGDHGMVLVLRHNAIDLAMNDAHWARFGLGKALGFENAAGAPLAVNPVRTARPEVPEPFRPLTLEQFQHDGGITLACDLALRHLVVPRYVQAGLAADDAYRTAVGDLLPGIILQPSGIFAVSVAQDAGCRYVPVS